MWNLNFEAILERGRVCDCLLGDKSMEKRVPAEFGIGRFCKSALDMEEQYLCVIKAQCGT